MNFRRILSGGAALTLTVVGVVALLSAQHGGGPPRPTADQAGAIAVRDHHRPTPADGPAGAKNAPEETERSHPQPVPVSFLGTDPSRKGVGPVLPRSRPVAIDIGAIGVSSDLVRLRLATDGTLQTPDQPLSAGWYVGSPTPGERGPSIIVGHVDSWATGPAVFYRLGQLGPGDQVVVTRSDGSHATFDVDGVREFPKARFPTRLVYGSTARAELRLITCGDWNEDAQEYDGNVVVFAHLTH